jgi:hypothetical protein
MRGLAVLAVTAILASTGAASAATLENGDFEAINIGTGNYFYPAGNNFDGGYAPIQNPYAGWTWSGNAGVINAQAGNAWYGSTSPSGFSRNQYAFVQTGGSFSQSFTVSSAETATLSWLSAGRPNFGAYDGDATYEVLVDGNVVANESTYSGQNFIALSVAGVQLLAGVNTLTFLNTAPGGDHTSFIDNVAVSAVPLPAALPLFGCSRLEKATQSCLASVCRHFDSALLRKSGAAL